MPSERPGPRVPAAPVDFSADAELVLAALGRMETAIRSERVALDRLQTELGEMAAAIAQAKSAMPSSATEPDAATGGRPVDLAALLDELEHRVDAMLDIAGGGSQTARADSASRAAIEPAPSDVASRHVEAPFEPGDSYLLYGSGGDNPFADHESEPASQAPESDRVPTVSGVVSRLGRSHDALAPDTGVAEDLHATGAQDADVPTVSMLEAMVEALNAAAPAPAPEAQAVPPLPEPEPQAADDGPQSDVTAAAMTFAEASVPAEPEAVPPLPEPEPHAGNDGPEAEVTAATFLMIPEAFVPAEPEASASAPDLAIMQEIDRLIQFGQMEAFPILPQEVGTAVIFTRAAVPESVPVDTAESDSDGVAAPQPAAELEASAQQLPEPPGATDGPSKLPALELLAAPPDLEQAAAPQPPELADIASQQIEPAIAAPEEVVASAIDVAQAELTPAGAPAAVAADAVEVTSAEPKTDSDAGQFLFGASSEPELAGSLLESAAEPTPDADETPPQAAPDLPPIDLAASAPQPLQAEEPEPAPAAAQPGEPPAPMPASRLSEPPQPEPAAAAADPLAPLKSMTAEERIALFS
jgi:hypothetical protein